MLSRDEILDIHNMCACSHTRMAARAVTRFYDEALRPSGLKGTQFVLLAAIEAGEAASITDLAEVIDIERTTLVRNLQLLRKEGLVSPLKGVNGRRKPTLTDQGRETLETALPLWRRAQGEIEDRLGYGSWQVTRRRLGDLRKAVA
ncbi:MarR family winged helix-turn-helix transcriptional regulator [Hansschlegelia plantiphila]|uniref:Transcriptional regulator n=1 Tax=Hansschlegelia plantiphila TaxID=374655 RepID=A0A9W6IYW8_9HYPH|nr:MarR family winged helix-turn-helix transcriptional regulator [Hansschlegelia plantiphila]GLK67237.1 transcriptional regulator [Hansschlegelia plantiphila]